MTAVTKPLSGTRLLVVEDDFLVAMALAEALEELGAQIAGVAGRLSEAMKAAEDDAIDGALVDVQLGQEQVTPLIEKLSAAGVPLILTTGYDASALPEGMRHYPRITKPFSTTQLKKVAQQVFLRE